MYQPVPINKIKGEGIGVDGVKGDTWLTLTHCCLCTFLILLGWTLQKIKYEIVRLNFIENNYNE